MATEVAGAAEQEHPVTRPWTWQWTALVVLDLMALAVIVYVAIDQTIWAAI